MRYLLALLLAALPSAALAHTGQGDAAGFAYGFAHPLGGLDHVLAMLAVGVLAFVLGGRALAVVPLAFIGMMLAGFGLGVARIELPGMELGIALSSVAIGGLAAWGRPLPVTVAAAVVGAFAVFHGLAHGLEMPATETGAAYAAGFVVATALLHAAGMGGAMMVARIAQRLARPVARAAGAAFALGGLGVLAGWL